MYIVKYENLYLRCADEADDCKLVSRQKYCTKFSSKSEAKDAIIFYHEEEMQKKFRIVKLKNKLKLPKSVKPGTIWKFINALDKNKVFICTGCSNFIEYVSSTEPHIIKIYGGLIDFQTDVENKYIEIIYEP